MITRRSYDQYCAAARALDVLGERWTILVVRELLLGPKRYTDLLTGLPGIGPNVLAARLRELQAAGVVTKRTLPPPAASTVYELTELGSLLRGVLRELTRWGANFLGPPRPGEHVRVAWVMAGMEASFRPELAAGLHESYEFRIDGEVFHIRVEDGEIEVRTGSAAEPAFVVTTEVDTFMAVGARLITNEEAVAAGRATFEGDPEAARRSIALLGPHFGEVSGGGGIVGALRSRLAPAAEEGVAGVLEFVVDDHHLRAVLSPGGVEVTEAPAPDADARFETDLATFIAIGTAGLTAQDAVAAERATISGDIELLRDAFAFAETP